jgi:predicted MPP superfamily phosphohydrolase
VRRRTLGLPRWPEELDGVRLLLVSDLHAGAPHVDEAFVERVVARAARLDADLVLLLGDFVDPEVSFGRPVAPESVAARLGRLGGYAVLGNHDWRAGGEQVAAALREAGITVLEDEAIAVRLRGRRVWLAGLSDPTGATPDIDGALSAVPRGEPLVVLSHDPDLFPRIPDRAALTVSGHTHGGQVNLPVLRARVIPSMFGDRYARGHVVEDERHLFVTSGVGTSTHPVRFARPPEIVVLSLRSSPRPAPRRRRWPGSGGRRRASRSAGRAPTPP